MSCLPHMTSKISVQSHSQISTVTHKSLVKYRRMFLICEIIIHLSSRSLPLQIKLRCNNVSCCRQVSFTLHIDILLSLFVPHRTIHVVLFVYQDMDTISLPEMKVQVCNKHPLVDLGGQWLLVKQLVKHTCIHRGIVL